MNRPSHVVAEDTLAQLRSAILDMNLHLERLAQQASSQESTEAVAASMTSFARLIKLLAIESAPEVQECPVCKNTVMRAAKLCGYCWAKLEPRP